MRRYFLFLWIFEYNNYEYMKKQKVLEIGSFVMRNNETSTKKPLIGTKGIVVSKDFYVDLDSMVKTPVSREEALSYGKKLQMSLPTKRQLDLISKNVEAINQSLHAVGRGDYMLFQSMQQDFWAVRNDKKDEKERRKVLFVVPM